MLNWVGKKPIEFITSYPSQLIEVFNPVNSRTSIDDVLTYDKIAGDWQNLLFHGDNKEVMGFLLGNGFRGKIDLVYIDPPFNTGVDYVRQVNLRGLKTEKLSGDDYSLQEQIMYYNNFQDDSFLQFLYERMSLIKELLSERGIIAVRIDYHFSHYLKVILDEVFGKDSFENELVVNRVKKNVTDKGRRTIPHATDSIFVYFNGPSSEYVNIVKKLNEKKAGYWHSLDSPGIPGPRSLVLDGITYYPTPGAHFKYPQKQFDELYERKRVRKNPSSGKLEYWVEETDEVSMDSSWMDVVEEDDVEDNDWTDIPGYTFTTGYPTENSEKLLERVIEAMSKPDYIVFDCFIGSGTTCAVAQKKGRRWIGCDINKGAIQTTSKRIQQIVTKQIKDEDRPQQKISDDKPKNLKNSFSFRIYKVNDYDLQLLRTEAIELAINYLGIQRTKTDFFFDGLLGSKLTKIIDFNHPLTVLDLQLIQDELKKRPEENRDITIVCLGKELGADPWIQDYNTKHPVNKFEVIELRTDKKIGRFLLHRPDMAEIEINRIEKAAKITIKNFLSPTIIDRLNSSESLLNVEIKDFRSMIDAVLIDNDYRGDIFRVRFSDVPKGRDELITGQYNVSIKNEKTMLAVKIISMLGEETLVIKEL